MVLGESSYRLEQLTHWSRNTKRGLQVMLDAILLPLALYLAYLLRLSDWSAAVRSPGWIWFALVMMTLPLFWMQGIYDAAVRYISINTLKRMVATLAVATLGLSALVFTFSNISEVPRSVLPIYFGVAATLLTVTRLGVQKLLGERTRRLSLRIPVAIYGAGGAGRQLAVSLEQRGEFIPVVFLDDDARMQGRVVQGLRVFSPQQMDRVIGRYGVRSVLVALPSIGRARRREILEQISSWSLKVLSMPSLDLLAHGRVQVSDLREVAIEDVLGREPVAPSPSLFGANIRDRVVLVTGAGGSIGSELCRQIVKSQPRCLLLLDQSEYALYEIERELHAVTGTPLVPLLVDVRQADQLQAKLAQYRPQTIFHAAAYKHVPLVEANPERGVENNVFGTLNTAEQALSHGVETFVLVSTDKAVRPTNVMGASKRLAEMTIQALAAQHPTVAFSMVRFGNVLGSSGSVIPLFREQIRNGGPITVTHPEMIRYFMTIPEAAQLVIQAGAMGKNGEVFVLDMGEPVKIRELAERMIRLSGLEQKTEETPKGDIEICYTGVRPGEKLYEELLISATDEATEHPKIRRAREDFWSWETLQPYLVQLRKLIAQPDPLALRTHLRLAVSGYHDSNHR